MFQRFANQLFRKNTFIFLKSLAKNTNKTTLFQGTRTVMTSEHHLSVETPVLYLKAEEAFNGLSEKEKKYAHHLSRASWWGSFIILLQSSPESPVIFSMLTRMFRSQSLDSLKEAATSIGFSDDEFKLLCIYYNSVVYNMGNYLGFGDKKFVPSFPKEKLEKLIKASKAFEDNSQIMNNYIASCLDAIYDLSEHKRFLGLPEKGVTCYFSSNCTKEDADLATEYMTAKNIEGWNSRFIKNVKNGETLYEIKLASIDTDHESDITMELDEYKGSKFCITRGDYGNFFQEINKELSLASQYVANDLEKSMLEKYIKSFKSGSQKAHKEGSIDWVNNKAPAIETYMGFIEVYRDPTNQRAEFESFVAAVNREQTRKFEILVSRASEEFIPLLPWEKEFEEDVFTKPDYSSLDVITFASSGLPIGINIPNYKEVKEEHGFKNVTLSNVISARSNIKGNPFISEEDENLKEKYSTMALEIDVGLHELLGHGSGKFLRRKDDGTLNFDQENVKNPFTGEPAGFYERGQNYQSVFTELSSSYEECRAEAVAMYLCFNKEIQDIFDIPSEVREDVIYVSWLDMMLGGLKGIEMYQPSQEKWGQAHCQARYVLLQVVLEAGQGLLTIEETTGSDGLPDLKLRLDRSKISTIGREAIGVFLKKLQVYRSMADGKAGREMFEKYSLVPKDGPHPFAKWHEIIVRKRKPRMILTMPNTKLEGDKVKLVSYPDGPEANIQSWIDRFSPEEYKVIEENLCSFKFS